MWQKNSNGKEAIGGYKYNLVTPFSDIQASQATPSNSLQEQALHSKSHSKP